MSFMPYREEIAESDVWKNLMGSIFPALAFALLPKLLQVVVQTAGGTQVKSILLRDWVIQRGIIAVGVQPEIKSMSQGVSACIAYSCFLWLKASIVETRKRKYKVVIFLQTKS